MNEVIQQRLEQYAPTNAQEEERALKEIIQDIALYALWRAQFFKVAAFQGGTSLRILHGLQRFSEDLDFILQEPSPEFDWSKYLQRLSAVLQEYGIESEALPLGRMDKAIRVAVIKDNSIVNQLNLAFYRGHPGRKLQIKLEIDINPPAGSGFDYTYLDFPTDFEVCHQDLSSNFALKIYALLCRGYLKGRDWYDFSWYIRKRVSPNLRHLKSALVQAGPWKGQDGLIVDLAWLKGVLAEKIDGVDWQHATSDVSPFLKAGEKQTLKLWSTRFFHEKVARLG